MGKKYKVLAEKSVAMKAEFNESDIPEGWGAWEYAQNYLCGSEFEEEENGGDLSVYDVIEVTDSEEEEAEI
tara:strand:- start:481 stop:693 length:213 start_codon:yes stop_codon:yes gene_type:complete